MVEQGTGRQRGLFGGGGRRHSCRAEQRNSLHMLSPHLSPFKVLSHGDATETRAAPKITRAYSTSGCVWIFSHDCESWSLFSNRRFFLQK